MLLYIQLTRLHLDISFHICELWRLSYYITWKVYRIAEYVNRSSTVYVLSMQILLGTLHETVHNCICKILLNTFPLLRPIYLFIKGKLHPGGLLLNVYTSNDNSQWLRVHDTIHIVVADFVTLISMTRLMKRPRVIPPPLRYNLLQVLSS